jgi:hypothetical protein
MEMTAMTGDVGAWERVALIETYGRRSGRARKPKVPRKKQAQMLSRAAQRWFNEGVRFKRWSAYR